MLDLFTILFGITSSRQSSKIGRPSEQLGLPGEMDLSKSRGPPWTAGILRSAGQS